MKCFVVSDTHSFYDELKAALDKAGYDKKNKDHLLIVCGDIFDRGFQSKEMLKFIKSVPKSRRILIRGNHEELFEELLTKGYPDKYDFSNGTVRTFCSLADVPEEYVTRTYWYIEAVVDGKETKEYASKPFEWWNQVKHKVRELKLVEWFHSDDWCDYTEIGKYIFVHSFIPVALKDEWKKYYPAGYNPTFVSSLQYDPDWRNASLGWSIARWGNPWRQYLAGLFKPEADKGKVLVCGHWHTSEFHVELEKDGSKDDYSIYFGEHLIAIDACTVISGFCNVLVFENGVCYDQDGNKLEVREKKEDVLL